MPSRPPAASIARQRSRPSGRKAAAPRGHGATVPATATAATTTTSTRCCSASRARSCSTPTRAMSRCAEVTGSTCRPAPRTRRPSGPTGCSCIEAEHDREGRLPHRPAVVHGARRHRHLRAVSSRRRCSRRIRPCSSLPFRSRCGRVGPPASWLAGCHRWSTVDRPIRSLYPRWNLTGRPALPPDLADAAVVHATNPAAIAPERRGQRLVVTVHDLAFVRHPELFPRDWRMLYRAGLRATARRADAVLVPSTFTADELREHSDVDAARVHVTPLASSLPLGTPDRPSTRPSSGSACPAPTCCRSAPSNRGRTRRDSIRAYRRLASRGSAHALVLNGPDGWLDDELRRELAAEGPGRVVRTHDAERRATSMRSTAARSSSRTRRCTRASACRSSKRWLAVCRRSPPTRSSIPEVAGDDAAARRPARRARDRRCDRAACSTTTTSRDDLGRRGPERAAGFSWQETARATLRVYRHVVGAR